MRAFYEIYVLALTLTIAGYIGSLRYFLDYLRRVHTATWVQLGQFELTQEYLRNDPAPLGNMLLVLRFLFSNRHRQLKDVHLSGLIWLTGILFTLSCFLFVGLLLGA